jgi:glutaredoxin
LITVKIYTKEDCHLCEEAKKTLIAFQRKFPFNLEEVDISSDRILYQEFKEKIPVVFIDEKMAFKYRLEEKELRKKMARLFRQERPSV